MANEFTTIALTEIDASDVNNIRQTDEQGKYAGVDALAEDIKKNGLTYPLLLESKANGGKFRLLDGFRRYNACLIAGLTEVPVKIVVVRDEKHAFMEHVKANVARRSLTTYEQAIAFARMRQDYGMGGKAIAEQLSSGDGALDGDTINNMARLVEKLDPSILEIWSDPSWDQHRFCTLNNLLQVVGKSNPPEKQLQIWEELTAPQLADESGASTASGDDGAEGSEEKAVKKSGKPGGKVVAEVLALLESAKGLSAGEREAAVSALTWVLKGGKLKIGDWVYDAKAVAKAAEAAKAEAKEKREAEKAKIKEAADKIKADAKAKLEKLHAKN